MSISKIILVIFIGFNFVSFGYAQDSQQVLANQILNEFYGCIQNSPKNKFSMCAYNLNQNISNKINDSDVFKSVGMIYSTKLYVVLSKYERNQISQEDLRIGLMTADAELKRDADAMERATAETRRQQSIYQQQMFNNAAQLLRGDGGGQVNCFSTPGVPSSFYCR